ncbi:MAG: MopE-related protein, partial [Pseudomonadota bacterium]
PLDSATACMRDHDGDGWGDAIPGAGRIVPGSDCDDGDDAIQPGAVEVCDEIDQDCDGVADDGLTWTWYEDVDGDGHGDPDREKQACEPHPGVAPTGDDCDDADAAIHPGAAEVCDEVDQDCDGEIDEGVKAWGWLDADGDGYGDPATATAFCTVVAPWITLGGDCDDADPGIHPGATEWCDEVDSDCDDDLDDHVSVDWYRDADVDGWGDTAAVVNDCVQPSGYVAVDGDCEDSDPALFPGAPDPPCDGIDQDCDGVGETECDLALAGATWEGVVANDQAGGAVAGVGDVNGDGLDDVLVGASGAPSAGSATGTAYLVEGRMVQADASLGTSDAFLLGDASYDHAGQAVAGAGDVDGDGLADMLVGAPDANLFATGGGEACLFFGAAHVTDTTMAAAQACFAGPAAHDGAGTAVAGAGDVDGDGLGDLLVGAPGADMAASAAGEACLFLGRASLASASLARADACYLGEALADEAGGVLAGGGDADGDGLDDLLIGASLYGTANLGAAYLVLGSTAPTGGSLADADARWVGEARSDYAGSALAWAGDVDGDGLDDALVGAPMSDAAGGDAGAVYLLLGASPRGDRSLADADARLLGAAAGEKAGSALAGGADHDGDGLDDLLIGAPYASWSSAGDGVVYLVLGDAVLATASLSDASVTLQANPGGRLGAAVAWAGDVDGDGAPDILCGAPYDSASDRYAGAAYLLSGAGLW